MITGKFVATSIRYWLSGSLATLIHFAVLILAIEHYRIDPVLASALGFCLAAIINYPLQFFWTFKVKKPFLQFFLRYLGTSLITLAINNEIFWLVLKQLSSNYLIAQLIASGTIIFLNTLLTHYYIYKYHRLSDDENVADIILISSKFFATFIRYFCSGGLAMLLHFSILILFIEHFSIDPLIATTSGFCLAVIFNYTVQFYWTFKVKGPHLHFFTRYLAVTLVTLCINNGLFWAALSLLHLPYLMAQILATGTVFLINFFINHFYTFKSHQRVADNA